MREPQEKRTVAFVDGQNLFYAVKEAFGYSYPNYDPWALARTICERNEWKLEAVHFYTGVPDSQDKPFWHEFWNKKLASMGKRSIHVFRRSLRYRNQTIALPSGKSITSLVGQEKGIDIRIALDMVRMAHRRAYDVALLLSQDQDLTEAVDEVKLIAQEQGRWIKAASAFPTSPTYRNRRGIDKTDWISIDRSLYDACLDPNDYRPKKEISK
ncbi:MAG: NYN domain-containing protein [Omnitrophica bacterium RIFCSPLOWO2_12_FULL_50_11]|nr:MAG: NYN domain-containing protein [Omnitrophica bacterium RIFCSPLOWO2_12_FULL_50_11]